MGNSPHAMGDPATHARVPPAASVTRLWQPCPWSDEITQYDRMHFGTYARLLDAFSEGGSEREIAQIIFGIDAAKKPEFARRIVHSHFRRAMWMADQGLYHLLW